MRALDKAILRILLRTPAKDAEPEIIDGGKGSGNWGHAGRPGLVGGSGKGGGKAFRVESKETKSGFIGLQRAKAFRSIANNARAYAGDYRSFVHSLSYEQQEQIKTQYKASGTTESISEYTKRLQAIMAARPAEKWKEKNKPVTGRDISMTYRYNPKSSKFDDEIEDVIHTQGFDGVPKIVSQAEFDKITAANPQMPVLFRSYSAPDADTLQVYDEMLEHGEWYVDCSTGGAQYGQGMYCAGVYGENKNFKHALGEMKHYRSLNEEKIAGNLAEPLLSEVKQKYTDEGRSVVWDNDEYKYRVYDKDGNAVATFEFNDYGGYVAVSKGNEKSLRDEIPPDGATFLLNGYVEAKREGDEITFLTTGETRSLNSADWSPMWHYTWTYDYDLIGSGKPVSSTRMMTLDPNAKIITWDDAKKLRENSAHGHADLGVIAAMYGYDAINAEGHGLSDSYTVVLNRTKLILSEQRVRV